MARRLLLLCPESTTRSVSPPPSGRFAFSAAVSLALFFLVVFVALFGRLASSEVEEIAASCDGQLGFMPVDESASFMNEATPIDGVLKGQCIVLF